MNFSSTLGLAIAFLIANTHFHEDTTQVEKYSQPENDIRAIAREITRYLNQHQFAADTVEGICHWWISKQRIEEEQKRVLAALEYLLQEHQLVCRKLPDGSLLYSALTPEDKFNEH